MVARQFSLQYLNAAANTVVDQEDLPRLPLQLGCSGFVVVGADGAIVTTKTSAFLDVGEEAFWDVERILGGSAKASSAPKAAHAAAPTEMASVGHDELDAEHEDIAAKLTEAVETKAPAALAAARDAFRAHATHEEAVMREVGFGQGGGMSAAASHAKDHDRVVALADEALAAAEDADASLATLSVKALKALAKERGADLAGCLDKLDVVAAVKRVGPTVDAQPFAAAGLRHTENFDKLYVDAIAKAKQDPPAKKVKCTSAVG